LGLDTQALDRVGTVATTLAPELHRVPCDVS
jgi:hypothetical protein